MGGSRVSWKDGNQVDSGFWGSATWADHGDHIHLAPGGGHLAGAIPSLKLPRFFGKHPHYRGAAGGLNVVAQAGEDYGNRLLRQLAFDGATSGGMRQQQVAALWRRVNPGTGDPHLMSAIAMAESGGVPSAHGPPDGRGLYQIEWPIWSGQLGKFGNPYNASANTRMAREVFQQQGLSAWVVYNTGAYRQYMQRGGLMKLATGGTAAPDGRRDRRDRRGNGGSKWRRNSEPWKWEKKTAPKLKRLHRQAARTSERIDINTRKAALPSSPAGAETSPGERLNLIRNNKKLLMNYLREEKILKNSLGRFRRELRKKKGKKAPTDKERDWIKARRKGVHRRLDELHGLTGEGGLIFDTREAIATLRGEAREAAEAAALEYVTFNQQRYEVLATFGSNLRNARGLLSSPPPTPIGHDRPRPRPRPRPGGGGGGGHNIGSGGWTSGNWTQGGGGAGPRGPGGTAGHGKVQVVNNYFKTTPTDPHTWARNVEFELRAMV
jgi:hypothetical protein